MLELQELMENMLVADRSLHLCDSGLQRCQ
jgi:hypothetical protein